MPVDSPHIYETPVLYNQHMDENAQLLFADFYRELFSPYAICTIHDATIGAGGTTLPLSKLGYTVSGSDVSENLLARAKNNFAESGFAPELFIADLRAFGEKLDHAVDCVISTGNSLPHVDIDGFKAFLRSAASRLNNNGLLFFDLRNWDAIDDEHPIMHAVNPHVMTAEEHVATYLLFNWHDDGSVTFIFATATDKNGVHEKIEYQWAIPYYPLLRKDIEAAFEETGFELIKYVDLDAQWVRRGKKKHKTGEFEKDFPEMEWYGVLARKK